MSYKQAINFTLPLKEIANLPATIMYFFHRGECKGLLITKISVLSKDEGLKVV